MDYPVHKHHCNSKQYCYNSHASVLIQQLPFDKKQNPNPSFHSSAQVVQPLQLNASTGTHSVANLYT